MFGSLGTGEILVIILIILLLFGAKKIPEVMRGLGTGMREFKRATREASDEFQRLASDEPEPTLATRPGLGVPIPSEPVPAGPSAEPEEDADSDH
jgi:sec-independent protein translocase protein TatA